MKKSILIVFISVFILQAKAQHSLSIIIKNKETQQPLAGAAIIENSKGLNSNDSGLVMFNNLTQGLHNFSVSHVGFIEKTFSVKSPLRA